VGPDCSVAVIGFIRGAASNDQRDEGLMEVIAGQPGIRVLATEYCNSVEDQAQALTQDIALRYPDVDAIVCLNAQGTVGAARAVSGMDAAGRIKIIGFDSTPEEIGFLEKGTVQALVVQNPYSMGYLGVKYAIDAIRGRPVPYLKNTDSSVVDKGNMYLPENQKLLFPFTN
jgi:ribose transport system substrate-binding protein